MAQCACVSCSAPDMSQAARHVPNKHSLLLHANLAEWRLPAPQTDMQQLVCCCAFRQSLSWA